MDKSELQKLIDDWELKITDIEWGKITIEIQRGEPVRIVEEISKKLGN